MKKPAMSLLLVVLASVSSAAMADKGRHGRDHKQEYWDGNCKVEQKWKKGEYKEKRKCKGPSRYVDRRYDDRNDGYRHERPVVQRYYAPAATYYPDYGRYDRRDPQVNIDIRIRQ